MKNQNLQQLYGQWAMDYKAFRDSGMTQAEWCSAAGININTFRYRLNKLRKVYGREEYDCDSKPNPDENSSSRSGICRPRAGRAGKFTRKHMPQGRTGLCKGEPKRAAAYPGRCKYQT